MHSQFISVSYFCGCYFRFFGMFFSKIIVSLSSKRNIFYVAYVPKGPNVYTCQTIVNTKSKRNTVCMLLSLFVACIFECASIVLKTQTHITHVIFVYENPRFYPCLFLYRENYSLARAKNLQFPYAMLRLLSIHLCEACTMYTKFTLCLENWSESGGCARCFTWYLMNAYTCAHMNTFA